MFVFDKFDFQDEWISPTHSESGYGAIKSHVKSSKRTKVSSTSVDQRHKCNNANTRNRLADITNGKLNYNICSTVCLHTSFLVYHSYYNSSAM
jgi:hypothetical protein